MISGYTVTLIPGLGPPLAVTRLRDEADLRVAGTTIADACHAILADHLGRAPLFGEVRALEAIAFGGLDNRGVVAVTVRAGQLERVVDAARRVAC